MRISYKFLNFLKNFYFLSELMATKRSLHYAIISFSKKSKLNHFYFSNYKVQKLKENKRGKETVYTFCSSIQTFLITLVIVNKGVYRNKSGGGAKAQNFFCPPPRSFQGGGQNLNCKFKTSGISMYIRYSIGSHTVQVLLYPSFKQKQQKNIVFKNRHVIILLCQL